MDSPAEQAAPEMFKAFEAESPGRARTALSRWLGDFSLHGPLKISRIRVTPHAESFVAVVVYSEMSQPH